MEASELRIGNYIVFFKEVGIVTQETFGSFQGSAEGRNLLLDMKPVELTEQWLTSFGFRDGDKYQRGFAISVIPDGYYFQLNSAYGWITLSIVVKYVHQLQNLYFALTGEELTIATPATNGGFVV